MKRSISLFLALLMFLNLFAGIGHAIDAKNNFNTITTDSVTKVDVDDLLSLGMTVKATGDKVEISNKDVKFEFIKNSNDVSVNNVNFKTVGKTEVQNNKIYVPFRFFFETMNYDVDWNKGKTTLKKLSDPKYPITHTNDGKKYVISSEPKKIVSLAPDITETIFKLGAGDKIIGRTQYCNYPQEALKIKIVGSMYEPKVETVVALKPDLIMAATHYKEEVLKKFESANLNTIVKNSPKRMVDAYEDIITIGNIINRNYEARALASTMKEKVNHVTMLTKNKNKPNVYFVVGTGKDGEYTHGNNTFVNDIILASGAKNIAMDADGYKYTLEKLIKNDPEYIFGANWAKDTMEGNSSYSSLSAIKAKKFIVIDEDVFSRPSERLVNDGIKTIIKIIHPDLLKVIDF